MDASPALRTYEAALNSGKLVICGQCTHFIFSAEPASLGRCQYYKVESWPFVPFTCAGFARRQKKAA